MTECDHNKIYCKCDVEANRHRIAELEKDAEELAARRWVEERGYIVFRTTHRDCPAGWFCRDHQDSEFVGLARKLGWKP